MRVYTAVDADGVVRYVGITNDIERRAAEHANQTGIRIKEVPGLGGLSRLDARSVEQALIAEYRIGKNGGQLLNRINSIASSREEFGHLVENGRVLLETIGFDW